MTRSQKSGPTAGKRADPQRVRRADLQLVKRAYPTAGQKNIKSIANCRHEPRRTKSTTIRRITLRWCERSSVYYLFEGGWKKPTKVDGSVDEKNGLKYTVGDKSLGLLSTTIDKALGGMLKGEEVRLKCSSEYAKEPPSISLRCRWPRNINRMRFQTRLPQRKQSQRMSLQRVSQPNRYRQRKWWSRRPQRRR